MKRLQTMLYTQMKKLLKRNNYAISLLKYIKEGGREENSTNNLKEYIAAPLRFGFVIIILGLAFFVVWGSFAPLDSASIADGIITVAGNRKTIQHLEGGVIEEILVRDGQRVKEGDVLLTLNDSHPKAQLKMIMSQLNFANAVRARLNAELNNSNQLTWDDEAFDFSDSQVEQILTTQANLFRYRRDEFLANQSIVNERITQNHNEIVSLQIRKKSLQTQKALVSEELEGLETLLEKGLALRSRTLEMRRALNDISASIAETDTKIAAAKESIAENNLKFLNIQNERQKEIAKETKENHSQILELMEKYKAMHDTLERTKIKAPVTGEVTDLKYHTIGGVISSGQKILDIVPDDSTLIIEAKVKTQDIESMYPGLIAKVQLNAYKNRLVPRLEGKVIYVAADAVADPHNGQLHYVARIEIDDNQIAQLNADIKLYPGMPATVFIVKGTRTFLQYLVSPITDSFYKAFKEK